MASHGYRGYHGLGEDTTPLLSTGVNMWSIVIFFKRIQDLMKNNVINNKKIIMSVVVS